MTPARLTRGALRYGPMFALEVVLFWLILEAVNSSGYGTANPWPSQPWFPFFDLLLVTLAFGLGEIRFRLYRRVWSVASLNDAFAIGLAVVEASLLIAIVNLLFPDGGRPLRIAAPILAAPAVIIAIGLVRLLPRLTTSSSRPAGHRLLVVIPDQGGYATVKALVQQPNLDWMPVAVVTTGPADVGRTLLGVPVVGTTANLRRWIKAFDVQGVAVVEGAAADRAQARRLFAECLAAELPVFIVPQADSWFPRPSTSRLRQLSADDLVGRDEREIDLELSANEVRDRVVLVTGAAGSIGSELCRLLAGMKPRRLVLVDINESGLFDLAEELAVPGTLDLRNALVSIVVQVRSLQVFSATLHKNLFHLFC